MVKKTSSVCDDPDQLENNNSSILLEMGYISTQTPHHDAQRWTKDLPDLPSTPSNISTLPKLRVDNQTSQAIDELTKADKLDESLGHIKVHGWMHKQGNIYRRSFDSVFTVRVNIHLFISYSHHVCEYTLYTQN